MHIAVQPEGSLWNRHSQRWWLSVSSFCIISLHGACRPCQAFHPVIRSKGALSTVTTILTIFTICTIHHKELQVATRALSGVPRKRFYGRDARIRTNSVRKAGIDKDTLRFRLSVVQAGPPFPERRACCAQQFHLLGCGACNGTKAGVGEHWGWWW